MFFGARVLSKWRYRGSTASVCAISCIGAAFPPVTVPIISHFDSTKHELKKIKTTL